MRITALALLALLALWGLALGAETQREVFLEPDTQARDAANQGAAGNLVVLTAFPVAVGTTGAALLLSRRPVLQRLAPAAALLLATYLGVLLAQSAWPNYVAVVERRLATLTISLLVTNLAAVPSLAIPALSLLVGTLLAAGAAATRLLRHGPSDTRSAEGLLQGQVAAVLLATPFLALGGLGSLRLLLALPDGETGLGPYYFVLPAMALACLALAGLAAAKTWHLGTYVRNARLGPAVQEAWQTLGRIELGAFGVLALLAAAGTLLEPAQLEDLALGRTFEVTLRGHTQLLLLVAIPLLPSWLQHRRVARHLEKAPPHAPSLEHGTHPVALAAVVAAACTLALGIVATWAIPACLWAWLLTALPTTLVAVLWCGGRNSAVHLLLLAFLLWGIGNTIEATYDGGAQSALAFRNSPGLLALWRAVAAVLAGCALARLATRLAPRAPATLALAAGAGLALGAVVLLELPLTAWLTPRPTIDAIAVGSIVASLDAPVRITLHAVAATLAGTAALLVARLHRPDWFRRRPRDPVAVIRPKEARRDRTPA